MFQDIKGFLQIVFCTIPATTICKPNKFEIFQIFGFHGNSFVTACRFIQFGTTASIKVSFYSINGILSFHDKIKLDYDTNAELREKRDILCGILSNSDRLPTFEKLDQGSYSMYTGVIPLDGKEYDIDVGLRFNFCKNDYTPLYFKEIIQEI